MTKAQFKKIIWDYYKKNKREFPWRETTDPYKILVSEIMLQQTQTIRVVPKYELFIKTFPNWQSLAKAPLNKVLKLWLGLGYNRRALNLKRTAEIITKEYKGVFPKDDERVLELPGIGPGSAGAVLVFSYNLPVPFIETNIRSVFIHLFFKDKLVHDKEIMPLIEKTLDQKNPRDWYYALYDYGAMLKKEFPNPSRKSLHHHKQSPFKGSNRELRSKIVSFILAHPDSTLKSIYLSIPNKEKEIRNNLASLEKEGLVKKSKSTFSIA